MLKTHLEIILGKNHLDQGRAKHIAYGKLVPRPYKLVIASYEEEEGYYLFHLSAEGEELSDTYHDSVQDAQKQAQWEFNVDPKEWKAFDSKK